MAELPRSRGSILIKGGRIIDPASGLDATGDVLIREDKVAAIRTSRAGAGALNPGLSPGGTGEMVIDAEGLIVCPGLIDPHVHLREPDETGAHEETIASGAAAAINGGFTTICCMPNTRPALDSLELVRLVHERAAEAGQARVFVVACATKGRAGRELSDVLLETSKRPNVQTSKESNSRREAATPLDIRTFGRLDVSPFGFTDDGDVVADPDVMREALLACKRAGKCFMQHCQEPSLTQGASMNAGPVAERLGQIGWPKAAEEMIVERDIELNRDIGAHYHAQHLSSGESAAILRRAQAQGQPVTGEVSPHHLLLTEDDIERSWTPEPKAPLQSRSPAGHMPPALFKMNPPLRTRSDISMLKKAIADGTITVVGTDHAPHPLATKTVEFARASFGIVGLDCALPLYAAALIDDGVIDWPRMIAMMSIEPARLTGLDRLSLGALAVGGPADVTLIDPALRWRIEAAAFASAGRNCPFDGWDVNGRAVGVIVDGRVRMSRLGERVSPVGLP